ncbi:dna repair protein-like protein rad18 [Zopfia rhizophila CBS 207.26]|uniref:Dna repair protein-like protein rad18 n=1 Tax=Zopfia rhizophila CBS 207.26 TaxID=1314779 RepID=A0A6A6D7L9_9PEZI|nr:dna repair protein-like protein rad18 [Zopfia rhizophila CBS 207.26]
MAPIRPSKRPRVLTDDVESASSDAGLVKQHRNKRARHSASDASDSDSSEDDPRHIQSGASAEPEDLEDADDDDQEQEADLLRATQAVTKQLRQSENRKNTPADNGIVEEIRCTNFMCHEQLTVLLGPLINFIIGHNGSGKSAVLTALTLCLGGKATATNRGQNLKSFIKEGKDFCNLSVKLKNQGTSAFKPDVYGRSIIVERHFNKAGTSGFKLKDVNGKIVSTKKAELEDIIDAFAFQIDNPMNVLTQDMARQFLNDSTPKDKYKFFLKGTQLETLNGDYNMVSDNLDLMEAKAEVKKGDLEVFKKRANEAVARAERAANLVMMRARETECIHKMAWAQVKAEEEKLEYMDIEIQRANDVIQEMQGEADSASEQYDRVHQAFLDAELRVENCKTNLEPVKQECWELEHDFKETRNGLLKIKATQRELGQKINSKKTAIARYQAQIQEHRQRQADADGGQHAQKVSDLEEASQVLKRLQDDSANLRDTFPSLQTQMREAQSVKQRADAEVQRKRDEIRRCEQKIEAIEKGQRNWMDSFPTPANLSKLLRAIPKERRFRETPVGPMGRYIKILKPEWSSILEKASGASLNAFVVTSKADQNVLSELMREVNCQNPIYIGKSDPIDTTGHEPDPTLDTWLRILKIDNDLVRNQLIVNHSIDQTVLIADRNTAVEFMRQNASLRPNVRMCFTMHSPNSLNGFSVVKSGSGAFKMDPIAEYTGRYRMEADKEPQLKAEKANLNRIRQELADLQTNARMRQTSVDSCQGEIDAHNKRIERIKAQLRRAQADVDRLEQELNDATPEAGLIERLEEDLRTVEEEKAFAEEQFQDTVNQKDILDEENASRKRKMETAQERREQLESEQGKAEIKARKLRDKREGALRDKNQALQKVNEAENAKSQLDRNHAEQSEVVNGTIEQASQICDRIGVAERETYQRLEKQLQRLQRERETSERELGGSEEELLHIANEAKRDLDKAKKACDELESVGQSIKESLQDRKIRWKKFRSHISTRARVTFGYLLSERNFRGHLHIHHGSHFLDIQVEPDITKASDTGRQTKTLSGGEKSFSTICLLLALWDAMGSPIRCLDEFDVFMDNVNRDISMKMMIGAARRAVGRQYILITPQAMGNVRLGDDVKIIKMNDPERGQTALNFGN